MSRIVEITSVGLDEFGQGVGLDPFGGSSFVGLRVPTLATPDAQHRYLFQAASFSLGEGHSARILGWRQLVTIGAVTSAPSEEGAGRFVEMPVDSPVWRFPDGNVSWHLMRIQQRQPPRIPAKNKLDLDSFMYRRADGPALLYEAYTIPVGDPFYTNLTAYTPPNLGKPYGEPVGQLGNVHDLRTQWRTHGAWNSLDITVAGPADFRLFISVGQTAGAAGVSPTTPPGFPPCMCEEQFLAAFSGAIYWRVGGSLIVDLEAKSP